jgi:hypothetical protein
MASDVDNRAVADISTNTESLDLRLEFVLNKINTKISIVIYNYFKYLVTSTL